MFWSEVMIEKTGDVVHPITAGIMGKQLYTAPVSVVSSEGVVDVLNLNLLILIEDLLVIQLIHVAVDRYIYHIHYCDVHTDLTYIHKLTQPNT